MPSFFLFLPFFPDFERSKTMSYFLENLWVSKFKKWIARWFHFLGRYFTNSYLPEQFKLPSSYRIRTEEELYKRVQQDLQKDFEMVCHDFRKAFEKETVGIDLKRSQKRQEEESP